MSHKPHFLEIPHQVAFSPQCHYALLPLPYERTVFYGQGTCKGPQAIIDASRKVDDFDEELGLPMDIDVQTLPPPSFAKLADAPALKAIKNRAAALMQKGQFVLSLGGEHTITTPLVEAAVASYGPLGVLQLDAHTDLRDEFQGTPHSHACVMRRIREAGTPTVHAGIRSCSTSEFNYIKQKKIPVFWAKDLVNEQRKKWINRIISLLPARVYLTIDIDVLDPSLVPGTGTPEPGGLSWFDVTSLIHEVIRRKKVVAADIVEVSPIPGSHTSEYIAARLAARLLMYHKHKKLL